MKHLIPYLQDDQKAADYLRQVRWPDGVTCPRCGSAAVEPRERCDNGLQRFNCGPCAARWGQQFAMFTDWTGSIFEESKLRPLDWLLVIGLWQLKLNATDIATAADIQARTAQRCINLLDGGIYETYHLDASRQLENQVEADECYQSAGSKGLARDVARHDRAPRQRGLQLRGRATAEMGRPPLLGLVQRRDKTDQDAPAAQVYLEVLENVRTATIKPIIAAKVKAGAQFFTDEYSIDHFTEADYDHRTVNHGAGEYARRDPDGVPVCTVTRWKAYGLACAISWTTSKGSANASCTCASHAMSSCTTTGTCPGVRPSKPPCGVSSRPRAIIGGGWPINIAGCR
jgi:transposase-like protein